MIRRAVRAFNVLESGKRSLSEQTGTETGTISLGFLNSLGVEMVPRLIKEYRQRHPKVQFTLVQSSGNMLLERLIEGGIDLCLSIYGVFEQEVFAGAIFWTKN